MAGRKQKLVLDQTVSNWDGAAVSPAAQSSRENEDYLYNQNGSVLEVGKD